MKVRVAFVGFSGIETIVGGTEADVEVPADTLEALLSSLASTFGAALLKRLCHEGNKIDSGVMVLHNDARVDGRELGYRFAEGDRVAFVRMVAGG